MEQTTAAVAVFVETVAVGDVAADADAAAVAVVADHCTNGDAAAAAEAELVQRSDSPGNSEGRHFVFVTAVTSASE